MNFPCILLLLSTMCAEALPSLHHNHQEQLKNNTSLENRSNGITGAWPSKQHQYYKHRALRRIHGAVNIMGWGVLLPIGAIIARYFKESSNNWYNLHIMSQSSGFILGTLGWGIGITIKNEHHHMSSHGVLGTLIFALATLQPDEEHDSRRYWIIYHNVLGYALIVLIIVNIFQGIGNQKTPKTWDFVYGAVLGVLGVIALALQILRWIYV
ncbi:hypothetical protein SASPL_144683 [Salvia splendens]|uniref:Cytochrome b561 domain-containing protein n=1 Tax=Salvia splendens TaxID=180675 RepID=A0A8X8WHF9_SALSN|nr:cytochrome b561 and DOMON domain-containing protein At5g47530-like [Salvia splendens]KAG6394104.1 hypothetical protein SASPL_144683 [Salvia splendens]